MKNKPIICLDFDGVIHSYTSRWQGARNIPDKPVDGALEFIVSAMKQYTVAILSSRSHQFGGRRAMKKYLYDNLYTLACIEEKCPDWLIKEMEGFGDPWEEMADWNIKRIIKTIKWPLFKPPAILTIDDRAITFNGEWPSLEFIKDFKPWNKR